MNMHVASEVAHEGSLTIHTNHSSGDDSGLIKLCTRALAALAREQEAEQRYSKALDTYEDAAPERPRAPGITEFLRPVERSSAELKVALKNCAGVSPLETNYRKRIAIAVAYERECAALDRSTGMSRLLKAQRKAAKAVREAAEEIVAIGASTPGGAAAKARTFLTCLENGFSIEDEPFCQLASSLAADMVRLTGRSPLPVRKS